LNTTIRVWADEALPWTLRQAALGHLLERLIIDRTPDEITSIMGAFVQRDPWRGSDKSISSYVIDWLRGHFIVLQPTTPAPRSKKKR
jgi:hypothetical protein